jgi:hypothetical protein
MVPWLVVACLHAVKRLHAQGRKQLTRACAHSRLCDDGRISRALANHYGGVSSRLPKQREQAGIERGRSSHNRESLSEYFELPTNSLQYARFRRLGV